MIEAVVLGQTRFHLPGLAADERGVAVGRRLLCLFSDLQRALGFFRSLSRGGALKELLGSLTVEEVRLPSGPRDVAVTFETAGSYAADPCAAAARAHQGLVFTGSQQHFVPYRDSARPMGSDLVDASVLQAIEQGYALYHEAGSDLRVVTQRLEFKDLLLRMAPLPLRPKELRDQRVDVHVLRVPRGLLPPVRSYLWRRRVDADVSLARPRTGRLFASGSAELGLVRCKELPAGALALMESTPGVEVYVPVLDQVLVQRGWRHPVGLDACATLFPRDEVVLFAGARREVERLQGPLQPIALDDITHIDLALEDGTALPAAEAMGSESIDHLRVDVRLVPDADARATAEAVLVPSTRLGELLALVHILPQVMWAGSEIALAHPFSVVLSPQGVRALPIGHALSQLHARVFVPTGMRFSPRLSDEIITDHFSLGGNDNIVFFPPPDVGRPFVVGRSAFSPLSRAAVHPEDMDAALQAVSLLPGLDPTGEPVVHHPTGGRLRRWDGLSSDGAPRQADSAQHPDERPMLPAAWSQKE